jgi:hypothetical protein
MEQYSICRHIKTNGLQCHAPALAGKPWCYFHNRLHSRHHRFRPNDANREYFNQGRDLELCALEDRESVQLAISVIINALATNAIETKRATALLYGLQLASMNTARLNTPRSRSHCRILPRRPRPRRIRSHHRGLHPPRNTEIRRRQAAHASAHTTKGSSF